MTQIERIEKLILDALKAINDVMPSDQQIEVSLDVVLFGENPQIDSLSLVSLVVDLESGLSEEFDMDILLTDDRAMTRDISPFLTVLTLRDYIMELVTKN